MLSRASIAIVLLTTGLAGCISADDIDQQSLDDPLGAVGNLVPASEQLWKDPQTAPHPAFGYPTLTTVPADAPKWWTPIPEADLPARVAGVELKAADGDQASSGAGIAVFGSIAVVPAWNAETTVFDISDPSNPVALSTIEDMARDVDIIAYPDGRIVAVFATDNGIVPVWDITDPEAPDRLGEIEPPTGSHNVDVVPGTPLLYNANSAGGGDPDGRTADGATGQTEIYDLTDPANPVLVQEWANGYGCHDITFHLDTSTDTYRAYCAGIEMTQIWDIADPTAPEVLVNIPVHHGVVGVPSATVPLVLFSHLAMVNQDASVLIVGDETGGGAAPACDAYVDTPAGSASGPLGNLWFYDISDETNPQLKSWFSPTHHYPSNPPSTDQGGFGAAGCTAHFGRLIPQEDRDLLAIGFYGAGVVLVDFTDESHPVMVDQWNEGTNTWDVWYYNGHLFTGDLARGLDVFTLV